MNQNLNDEKIKELFGELRREDARRVPSFAKTWGQASARREKDRRLRPVFQIAALASIFILLISSVTITFALQAPPFSDLVRSIRFDYPAQAQPVWLDQQQQRPEMNDGRKVP